MKKNSKLALLLVSLMTFSGCDIYVVNSIDPTTSSNANSSTTVEVSSTNSETSSEASSETSSDTSSEASSDTSSNTSSDTSSEASSDTSSDTSSEASSDTSSEVSSESSSEKPAMVTAVYSFESKATLTEFENNKKEQTNKRDEFVYRDNSYQIGDDNRFNFKPQLSTITIFADETYHISNNVEWSYNITLSLYEDEEFKVLTAQNDYVESLNASTCDIDFSDAAVNKTFKISVSPKNLSTSQQQDLETRWTRNYVVDVIDGYNVYDEKELAYITNVPDGYCAGTDWGDAKALCGIGNAKEMWDNFKGQNGLVKDYYPSAVIIHKDLKVTKDHLPSEYFYSHDDVLETDADYPYVVGSLIDYAKIYYRAFADNKDFTIEGNYFKLDAHSLPTVVRPQGKIVSKDQIVSVAQLFYFGDGYHRNISEGKATIQNLKLEGNAPRAEDIKLGGGIIMAKCTGVETYITNCITLDWYISYFADHTYTTSEKAIYVDACKSYNNFNSFVYSFGGIVHISNSEFIQAGGFALMQDHVFKDDMQSCGPKAPVTTVTNSVLENYVTGSEGWFRMYAAMATDLLNLMGGISILLNSIEKTLLKDMNGYKYFNLISLTKAEGMGPSDDTSVTGELSIDEFGFDYGKSNPYFKGFYNTVLNTGAPMLYTSAGGMSYVVPGGDAVGIYNASQQLVTKDNAGEIAQGDEIGVYVAGMQLVLGYMDAQVA